MPVELNGTIKHETGNNTRMCFQVSIRGLHCQNFELELIQAVLKRELKQI